MTLQAICAWLLLVVGANALPCVPAVQDVVVGGPGALSAAGLAQLVQCSGGSITAEWRGEVAIAEPVRIGVGTSLSIVGAAKPLAAVADGGNVSSLFAVPKGAVLVLNGLRLENGKAKGDSQGGAVTVEAGGELQAKSCTFSGNTATYGGAIAALAGSKVTVTACLFTNSEAEFSGAIDTGKGAIVSIIESQFIGNKASGNGGDVGGVVGSTIVINSSQFTGGAAVSQGGSLGIEGVLELYNSTFAGSKADSGGAIVGGPGSQLTVHLSHFVNTTANMFGGAIAMYGGLLNCTSSGFNGNQASELGGSVYGTADATVGVPAKMAMDDCTFVQSTAGDGGGAVAASPSVLLATDCNFTRNGAAVRGGAVFVDNDSSAVLYDCILVKNGANEYGGGVYTKGSLISDSNVFHDNQAGKEGGGAYCAEESALQVISTNFTFNSATSGGALSAEGNVTCEDAVFTDNSADSGGSLFGNAGSIISLTNTALLNSWAVVSGGAIETTGTLNLESCQCVNNTASTSGGSIHGNINSVLNFNSVTFSGSQASVGGAVAADGNLTCSNAEFLGNVGDRGGALSISAAHAASSVLSDSSFIGNTASKVAGALLLASPVSGSVTNCTFTNNTSITAGAVFIEVSTPMAFAIHNTTLLGNIATGGAGGGILQQGEELQVEVDEGTLVVGGNEGQCCYAGGEGDSLTSASCLDVSAGYSTGWPCCSRGEYIGKRDTATHFSSSLEADGLSLTCLLCDPQTMDCGSAVGITTATLPLASGHWREIATTETIRDCWYPGACDGGVMELGETPDAYCATGYEGPYCALCQSGWIDLHGGHCVKCSSSAAAISSTVICGSLVVLLVLLWLAFAAASGVDDLRDSMSTAQSAGSFIFKGARFARELLRALRVPFVAFQIITQYVSITGVTLPLAYQQFLRWLDVVNLDVRWILSIGCFFRVDFYQKLLVTTLTPLVLVAVAFGACWALIRYSSEAGQLRRRVMHFSARRLHVFLVFTFVIFSGVSTCIFQTFACDFLAGTGEAYLRADYSLRCYTPQHDAFRIYAGAMILVYPIGIPALYAWVLWQHHRALEERRSGSSGSSAQEADSGAAATTEASSFLWKPYKERAYFWETIECFRRLALTSLLVFIVPGTAGQSAVGCLMSFFTIMAYGMVLPHHSQGDHWQYALGATTIFITMFTGFVLENDYMQETGQDAVGGVLIVLNLLLLLLAVVQAFYVSRDALESAREVKRESMFGLWGETEEPNKEGSQFELRSPRPSQSTNLETGRSLPPGPMY